MPLRLARGLAAFDIFPEDIIGHLRDDSRFNSDSGDADIYRVLSQDNPRPVVVSCDLGQRTRGSPEREALRASGLTVVFFAQGFAHLSIHPQAVLAIRAWPDIRRAIEQSRMPTLFQVTAKGKVGALFATALLKS